MTVALHDVLVRVKCMYYLSHYSLGRSLFTPTRQSPAGENVVPVLLCVVLCYPHAPAFIVLAAHARFVLQGMPSLR